ncbi:chalcone isomerase family protein [Azonexus fungiphilus]|uniref:chalcone isomerase family protein n=1 Tax=Azonexus fungiphilus TaxID=146940 RepID=UPI00156BBC8D|nr:chalcone isomerase family protein [Azonexus fungiphilus]NHC07511.1 hypothetical protein [Azonexus fungiphilus]
MSSSSNSHTADPRRRRLLLGLAGLPLAAGAAGDPTQGLQRRGQGRFTRFGLLIYEATLWSGASPEEPPLALRLDYRRAIARASVDEMRRLGADEASLSRWGAQMAALFPDVRAGDAILGVYQPGRAEFLFNGRWLGAIDDAEFARRFFAIWLDPRTSAPALRAALLGAGG